MTREEAINIVRKMFRNIYQTDKEKEALETLVPELTESEDEKMLREIKRYIKEQGDKPTGLPNGTVAVSDMIAWLEKQKDASKAIEAVDRIDKYIDEHLANAHDMKDSNPDKKYYRGWDDALGEMARILQDVYSREKQKESLRNFIDDFPYSDDYKERKPSEWSEEDEEILELLILNIGRYMYFGGMSSERILSWLKSLRPQYHGDVTMMEAYKMGKEAGEASHWKPSKHQMTILKAVKEYVGKGSGYWGEGLGSLIDDLEKL